MGDSIIVGKDELLGMGKDSILTIDLITCLNSKNVYFLIKPVELLHRARSAPIG